MVIGHRSKLMFWRDATEKPEQYRIVVARKPIRSRHRAGRSRRTGQSPASEKILTLLKDQLKYDRGGHPARRAVPLRAASRRYDDALRPPAAAAKAMACEAAAPAS